MLSFENAVCDHYVTEKFWRMKNLVVPVVLKRSILDHCEFSFRSVVQAHAPFESFVAADDFRHPRDLAKHLMDVAADKQRYMELALFPLR